MVALQETVVPSSRPPMAGRRPGEYAGMIAKAVDREITSATLPISLSRVAHAQFDEREDAASVFGLLTLYTYESAGGEYIADAVPAAAAVELVAAAASVLDDLQDMDPVPGVDRDDPGAGAELVALLLSLSQRALTSMESRDLSCDRLVNAQKSLANFEIMALAGQHMANGMSNRSSASLNAASDAVAAKSGSFGRLAAEVGAALGTDSLAAVETHGDFGEHVAIIDQLQNDVSGVWPGGETSTDIELGRQTPPLVFALEVPSGVSRAADEVKEALRHRDASGNRSEQRVREALFRSGAVHYAWIIAAIHKARASEIAHAWSEMNPNSRIADLLTA